VSFLDFVVMYKHSVVDSYFKKKEDHLVTFKNDNIRTQIEYFLVRANNKGLLEIVKCYQVSA